MTNNLDKIRCILPLAVVFSLAIFFYVIQWPLAQALIVGVVINTLVYTSFIFFPSPLVSTSFWWKLLVFIPTVLILAVYFLVT